MNFGSLGRFAMLAGSLVLGVVAGWVGFWIFEGKVPAAMQTAVLKTEARVYYLGAGLVLGVLIYGWTRATAAIARYSAVKTARTETPAKP